jgi:hypothetical protein
MAVYVDEPIWKLGRMKMCHMMTDGDMSELHTVAQKLGLKREWFQGDHYDISMSKRSLAVSAGLVTPKTSRFLVALRRARMGK